MIHPPCPVTQPDRVLSPRIGLIDVSEEGSALTELLTTDGPRGRKGYPREHGQEAADWSLGFVRGILAGAAAGERPTPLERSRKNTTRIMESESVPNPRVAL